MTMFEDQGTRDVYIDGFAAGIPKHVARRAKWIIQLLLAANSWQDVSVIGTIYRFTNERGRYGIRVDGKWHIVFSWVEEHGAARVTLERR